MAESISNGWGFPLAATKAHYFVEGRSLCRRWLFLGMLEREQTTLEKPGPSDCKPCHREAVKRLAAIGGVTE